MERQEVTPFRLQILMNVAARVVKIMVTGVWHLTFEEMDMVLELVKSGIEESRRRNEADRNGEEAGGQAGCEAAADGDHSSQV